MNAHRGRPSGGLRCVVELAEGIVRTVGFALLLLLVAAPVFPDAAGEEENAAPIYREAGSLLTVLPEDFGKQAAAVIQNGWPDSDQDLKDLLSKNSAAMERFKKASGLPNCLFVSEKPMQRDMTSEVPGYRDELKVAKLLLMRGRLSEKEEKLDSAVGDYLAVLGFGNHLGQQKNFKLLSRLLQIILWDLSVVPVRQYVLKESSTQKLQSLLDRLLVLRNQESGLEGAFDEEKEMQRNTIMAIPERMPKGSFRDAFSSELERETTRLSNEFFESAKTAFRENNPAAYEKKLSDFWEKVKEEAKPWNLVPEMLFGRGHPPGSFPAALVAKVLVSVAMPAFSKPITKYYISLAGRDTLIAGAAVRIYELNHGQPPDDLKALVPALLPSVPTDPFNGFKPLKYEKRERGWVVYSFGPDRRDDQGEIEYSPNRPEIPSDILFSS